MQVVAVAATLLLTPAQPDTTPPSISAPDLATVTVPRGAAGFDMLIDAVDDLPLGEVAAADLALPLTHAVTLLHTARQLAPNLAAKHFNPVVCRRLGTYRQRFDLLTLAGRFGSGTVTTYTAYANALADANDCG